MTLYDSKILRWATRVGHTKPIDRPTVEVSKRSRVCGSHMTMQATVTEGRISDVAWDLNLCAVGQAVAGVLSDHIIDLDETGFRTVDTAFRDLVKTGDASFPDNFKAFADLNVIKDYPSRHGSALLPFECLKAVFAHGEDHEDDTESNQARA